MTPLQESRLASVSSPLGPDRLLFWRMTAKEEISRPFEYHLDLLSEDHNLRLEDLLGQPVTVQLQLPGRAFRSFNGIVARFRYVGSHGTKGYAHYTVELRPWLWLLTRSRTCRIFQRKTVPQIIAEVFQDHGFSDFKDECHAPYAQRDYCVQYRESAFDFCSRLMEHEGIYYYFRHEDGKHTLVMGDNSTQTNETLPTYEKIPFRKGGGPGDERIESASFGCQVQSGRYTLRDFDFTKPKVKLEARRSGPRDHKRAELEVYDYPGSYLEAEAGNEMVGRRLEELHSDYGDLTGSGKIGGLMPGSVFTVTDCPRDAQNGKFFTLKSELRIQGDDYESGGSAEGSGYVCDFTAMDAKMHYRPARRTPKPFVQGPQTAIVVGPAGEELHTDSYGRVKCQFHWDRDGKQDENASCWVRVSQPWAGRKWGAVSIPRIGQEVVVDFLEGDPDQPLVTGRVYNADTLPPYKLPDEAMLSGIKSNSTKGGGGYNEYVMDDSKGKELIREHAQFDKDSTVRNDLREHVLKNRSRDVGANETVTVGEIQSLTIGKDQRVEVKAGQSIQVKADRSLTVEGNQSVTVHQALSELVKGAHSETVENDFSLGAKSVVITADDEITLKTGQASINLKSNGDITINGKQITLNGTGNVIIKGSKVISN